MDGRTTLGSHGWVLSYRQMIAAHFARVPDGVLGPDGESASSKTIGRVTTTPTKAHRVRLIGREANLLDRTGLTTGPVYSDYTDDRAAKRLALAVLRDHGYRSCHYGRHSEDAAGLRNDGSGSLHQERRLTPRHEAGASGPGSSCSSGASVALAREHKPVPKFFDPHVCHLPHTYGMPE